MSLDPSQLNGGTRSTSRARTPVTSNPLGQQAIASETDLIEEDPRVQLFNNLYTRSEAKLERLLNGEPFSEDEEEETDLRAEEHNVEPADAKPAAGKRAINEDDYDDSEEEDTTNNASPLRSKSTGLPTVPNPVSPARVSVAPPSPALTGNNGPVAQPPKGAEVVRQQMDDAKRQEEYDAKRSFNRYYWTLDNDRTAMLEQQRLEESERQLDVEMSSQTQAEKSNLASSNLGASSLVLQHLLRRIDAKRDKVKASDQQLRALLVEVKKNRSKWASEDRIGQEDLYESCERILNDLKSNTTHSSPFLSRVNKKDAPDYYHIIKEPMDLGWMTKKLKTFQYKSKQDFCYDLNLIWANCKKYNDKPGHFLRKHADEMEKMAQRLVPLIPDIIIRDRAEVEAEERRAAAAEGADEAAEESDDEPIIASRGRKATSKKARKGAQAPQAPDSKEDTPAAEARNGITNGIPGIRKDFLRADSDTLMEGATTGGLNTPPPGTLTPGLNGTATGSQGDAMEIDNLNDSVNGVLGLSEVDYDDHDYKIWKQVTKKDRAAVTAERHRLFKGDKLNPEEPALLRSRAGMRHWIRRQRESDSSTVLGKRKRDSSDAEVPKANETLADGLDEDQERMLPDYYDTMSAVPDILPGLQWKEDSEGFVVPGCEETLRLIPPGYFQAPMSNFSNKMSANMRQVQETRKICAKIGVVKQMQLQTQLYSNQFQKYDPEPLFDHDVEAHVVSDDGPVMAPYVCRAAMQRSVGKIFFNTGFEEYQPSAIDAMTDLATDFMVRLGVTLSEYMERPKIVVSEDAKNKTGTILKPKHSLEEALLLALNANGLDLESLEAYGKEDADKFGSKLATMHERMKGHLSDLLRPALSADAGPDGVNAFNDGSEQFVGGDFAEDLGEDFFGFKELGLDKEFGLAGLSVPLHLLHNRMHRNFQSQTTSTVANTAFSYPTPPPFDPVTKENFKSEIGILQNFLSTKLQKNHNLPLTEDEDLPQKQRLPKPRLPPNGKITSPRKRPIKEAGPGKGHPKKKMRYVEGEGWIKESELAERERQARETTRLAALEQTNDKPGSKLKQSISANDFDDDAAGEEDVEMSNGILGKKKMANDFGDAGMISPESLEAS